MNNYKFNSSTFQFIQDMGFDNDNNLKQITESFGFKPIEKSERNLYILGFFDKYLNDSEELVNNLEKITKQRVKDMAIEKRAVWPGLIVAPTGSGKTYTLNNIKGLDFNIQLCPYRTITDQVANKYGTTRVLGGDFLQIDYEKNEEYDPNPFVDDEELGEGIKVSLDRKNFSVLMDKCDEMKKYLIQLKNNGVKLENGLVWVDEAHVFCESASFRKNAYRKFQEFIKWIEDNTFFNIMYVTATPERCQLLDFDNIYVAIDKNNKSNIKKVVEYRTPQDKEYKDVIKTYILKELQQNHKVVCNLNNKTILANLVEDFENNGYKVGIVTGDNKENNVTFDLISNNSELDSELDVLFVTCVLDAGVSIDSLSDGNKDHTIVPIYCYNQNSNLDNLKQFSNRFRFEIDKMIILVDKHEEINLVQSIDSDGQNEVLSFKYFAEIMQNNEISQNYNDFKDYLSLLKKFNMNEEEIDFEMKKVLNKKNVFGTRNDLDGIFEFKNGNLIYNSQMYYNRLYEEYQRQFFYIDSMREYFIKYYLFNLEEIEVNVAETMAKYTDYKEIRFDEFLTKLQQDEELQKDLVAEQEHIDDEIKENKKFGKLLTLLQYQDINKSINDIRENSPQELGKLIKTLEFENNVATLTKEELKLIKRYLKNGKIDDLMTNNKVLAIIDSDFIDIYRDGYLLGIDLNVIQEKLAKDKNIRKIKEFYELETIIQTNEAFIKKDDSYDNQSKIQYSIIEAIEEIKTGNQITLKDDVLEEIEKIALQNKPFYLNISKVYKSRDLKNQIKKIFKNKKTLLDYLKKVYTYREDKNNATIIISKLRLSHPKED